MSTNQLTDRAFMSAPLLADIERTGSTGILSSTLIDRYGQHVKAIIYRLRKRGNPIFGRFELEGYRYWSSEELAGVSTHKPRDRKPQITVAPGVRIRTHERDVRAKALAILDAAGSSPVPRAVLLGLSDRPTAGRCVSDLRREGKCFAKSMDRPAFFWRHETDMLAQTAKTAKAQKPPKPPKVKQKPGPKPNPLRAMKTKVPPQTPPTGEVSYLPGYKFTSEEPPPPKFYVGNPPPVFSGLRLGSYYDDGSHMARVYP